MKRIFVFLLVLFVILDAQGQRKKVGLVLSGGGAKGVAHPTEKATPTTASRPTVAI